LKDGGKEGCRISDSTGQPFVFKSYPERWWLLATVVILNLANYSHWVAFPSVAKNAAKYYDQVKKSLQNIIIKNYAFSCSLYVSNQWEQTDSQIQHNFFE